MAIENKKLVATFFILLLAGSEAVRISQHVDRSNRVDQGSSDQYDSENPAESRLTEMNNKQCKWSTFRGGCAGEGCRLRPLPLDRGLSRSCRLSDRFMLSTAERATSFAALQSQMLVEKAGTFKVDCSEEIAVYKALSRTSRRCYRRAAQMVQASEYLVKLEEHKGPLHISKETYTVDIAPKAATAFESLTDVLGEDGAYLLELKRKMTNNFHMLKNPRANIKEITSITFGLTSSNMTVKLAARENLKNLPEPGTPSDEDKRAAAEALVAMSNSTNKSTDEQALWRKLEGDMPSPDSNASLSDMDFMSLLQVDEAVVGEEQSGEESEFIFKTISLIWLVVVILWTVIMIAYVALLGELLVVYGALLGSTPALIVGGIVAAFLWYLILLMPAFKFAKWAWKSGNKAD